MNACYPRARSDEPFKSVSVDFVIENGRVSSITSNGFDAAVVRCIEGVLRGAHFPRPTRGVVTVSAELELRSNDSLGFF